MNMEHVRASMDSRPTLTRRSVAQRIWRRLLSPLGMLGLGLTMAVPVQAPALAAPSHAVPQHWLRYAERVSNQFQSWLDDPLSESVVRLHAWLQERLLREGQAIPPAPLVVRVWIEADGRVERLEFDSLGNAQADADLRSLLTAEPLSAPPPADMPQPLTLQLDLEFATGL